MNKKWIQLEKSVGVFQLVFSLSLLIMCQIIFLGYEDFYKGASNYDISISYWSNIIREYHFIFISIILGFIAGTALLNNKRIGYILSVLFTLSVLIRIVKNVVFQETEDIEFIAQIILLIIAAGLLVSVLILISSHVRRKYKPKMRDWILILTLLVLAAFSDYLL